MKIKLIFINCAIVLSAMFGAQVVFANTPPYADFSYEMHFNSFYIGFCYPHINLWLDASACYDAEDPGNLLEVRWTIQYGEYGSNNTYTSTYNWTTDRYFHYESSDYYPFHVKLEVKDTGGLVSSKEKDLSYPVNMDLTIEPSPLDFGNVDVGSYYDQTVRFTNIASGNCVIHINGITSTNFQFEVIGPTTFDLDKGNYQDVTVRFSPTAGGYHQADLNIESSLEHSFFCINNVSVYGTVNLSDLYSNPSSLAISPTTVEAGNTFDFSGMIQNQGAGSTGADFQVNVFICPNPNELTFYNATHVGAFYVGALDPGSNYSFNETVTVPLSVTTGTYYVWVSIDPTDAVTESNETNNQQSCGTPLEINATGIEGENSQTITHFDLHQNYPNPFNPSTTIQFSLPKSVYVSIKIYDLLGNEIETLLNGYRQTGEYQIEWNAEDFPSGIYLCRLVAGDYVETKKLILQK